ncbi:MAG TPA: HNH endonuclease domain-containing protein [Pyrinomonadaceae bacterium]|nr:HNH endonuclease domain-containing protein [Pyrinomonadaceae bacterium]
MSTNPWENIFRSFYAYPFKNAGELTKLMVWQKGTPIDDFDASVWRRDMCGNVMRYSDHGDTNSAYGWEIDHIYPQARGGSDALTNLQPLYWENNRKKGDTSPWYCS